MTIVDLQPAQHAQIEQVAALLRDAFAALTDTWATLAAARDTVMESFQPRHLSRVALDVNGDAVGWIGGIPQYDGNVYELHPLVVKPSRQRQGIGRALVADLEEQARARGALTVVLGTDDEFGGTNLYGQDLYPDIAAHIAELRNVRQHPYEFYQKCGYVVYGILPDANGLGRHDILMAKRVGQRATNQDAP